MGFDEVKISNINYMPNAEVTKLKAFTDLSEKPNLELKKDRGSLHQGKGKKPASRFIFPSPRELTERHEQPTATLFINVDGEISPCVYLNLPTRQPAIIRVFNNKEYN